jgi:hypothetical protein
MQENQFEEEKDKQIICFINPSKFHALLGSDKSKEIGFCDDDDVLLNDGEKLVYIDSNNLVFLGGFDEAKAGLSSVILIPDSFPLQYSPIKAFKILYHGETDELTRVKPLTEHHNFRGKLKSMEEILEKGSETLYYKIAKSIKLNHEPNKRT